MTYASKYPTEVNDIPADTKFLVLINDSYSYDDGYDGRSTAKFLDTLTFSDEETLKQWVLENTTARQWSSSVKNPKDIVILPYKRININIETRLDLK